MEKLNIEQIGLRVSEELNVRLDNKANEIGISKNALILVLIDMGFKIYDSLITANRQS